jgi:3-dehydroquinate synthase
MLKAVEKLHISSEKIEVEIVIGAGVIKSLPRSKTLRTAVIADAAIASTYGKEVAELLGGELFTYSGGEEAKTRAIKQKFEDALLTKKFGRDTLLIGLGGGVVTDFTAFLAATYMRGVPLILIPTTLLAMVDAAIGGKCGVDTPFGKNLIGVIYHPSHIFIDMNLLSSLPEKEWIHGLAEILKYGLIADFGVWELLEKDPPHWKKSLSILIHSSIRVKKSVVEKDPRETAGIRRILNFGHTVAHALEMVSHYKMPHGEAVAVGCLAESVLSRRLGLLNQDDLDRIKTLFRKFPFSFKLPPQFAVQGWIEAMQIDKKAKGGEPRFVLIDRIGHAVPFDGEYCRTVPVKELETVLQEALA